MRYSLMRYKLRFALSALSTALLLLGCNDPPPDNSSVIVTSNAPANIVVSGRSAALSAALSSGAGANFSWRILSGGGGLSGTTGTSVTYTAPDAASATTIQIQAEVVGQPGKTGLIVLTAQPLTVQGLVFSPITPAGLGLHPRARLVPGEAIVRWREGGPAAAGAEAQSFRAVRRMGELELLRLGGGGVSLQSVGPDSAGARATLEWIAELRARPDVAFAEPNYLRFKTQTTAAPGDPLYAGEIRPRFDLINVNAGPGGAWRLSNGSSGVVVAVLDDGILWRGGDPANTHPDFGCGRVVPGYDMVSSPATAGDGDGRDPDPYNQGDDHGSHVAGTIAACTDNAEGVSGVDWKARLLPVRVLGEGGGTDADIIDGLRWAVGLPVAGVPANPPANRAKVINMSLGGFGFSQALDDIFEAITDQGAVVVAAAGNDNADALLYWPAGAERVITVGAVNETGQKADFSNFGPGVEVMAPGVQILSTTGAPGSFTYTRLSGTSMASPHVAGVVALMAAVRPGLTWVEAIDYLKKSATPVAGCAQGCGAGLVNAADAVARAQRGDAVGAFISPSRRLEFGPGQTAAQVTLRNHGGAALSYGAVPNPRLSLNPASGSIAAGQSVTAGLSLTPPTDPSIYYSTLLVNGGNGHQAAVLALYQVGSGVRNLGPVRLALCREVTGSQSEFLAGSTVGYAGGAYRYSLPVANLSGSDFYLRAWVDADNDNLTEYMSSRRYIALDGNPKSNVGVLLTQRSFRLSQQGCIATTP